MNLKIALAVSLSAMTLALAGPAVASTGAVSVDAASLTDLAVPASQASIQLAEVSIGFDLLTDDDDDDDWDWDDDDDDDDEDGIELEFDEDGGVEFEFDF